MFTNRRKLPLLLLIALQLGCLGWFTWQLVHVGQAEEFAPATLGKVTDFRLSRTLGRTKEGSLSVAFPYQAYLDSTDLGNLRGLSQDVQLLDSLYPANGNGNERLMYAVLTDSLASRLPGLLHQDTLTMLSSLMGWARQLPVAAQYDSNRSTFFRALHLYWVKRVATTLEGMYRRDPDIKYSFQFKHLNQLCREAKCGVPTSFSAPEKVLNNVVGGNWSYLFTKFWRDATTLTKLGAGLLAVFLLFPWAGFAYAARARAGA